MRTAVAVVLVLLTAALLHLLGLLLLALAVGGAGVAIGRRLSARTGQPATLPPAPAGPSGQQSRPGDRRGRGRWLPPVRGGLVSVCTECAAGSCVWCNDARCQCEHPNAPQPDPADRPPLTLVGDDPPF
jgi:hypothetical protein